jgi:hypothetical protein
MSPTANDADYAPIHFLVSETAICVRAVITIELSDIQRGPARAR